MGRTFQMGAKMTLKDNFTRTISKIGKATNGFTKNIKASKDGLGQYRDAQGRLRDSTGKYIVQSKVARKESDNLKKSMTGLHGAAGLLKKAFAALGIVAAFKAAKTWLIDTNADMETYKNTLTTVLKSEKRAIVALKWASDFAASTPFEIPEIVEATTRMAAYGMSARKSLGIIGDMASVMGKDLMQAVEAVADAQTGELERLKEFGITKNMITAQAKAMKMTVVNNKGQITNQENFNKVLFAIMQERYSGGMEMQSKSLKGMLSNLSDFMGTTFRTMGQPVFDKFKQGLSILINWLERMQESGALDAFIGKVQAVGSMIYKYIAKCLLVAVGYVKRFSSALTAWYATNKPMIMAFANQVITKIQQISGFIIANFLPTVKRIMPIVMMIIAVFKSWYQQSLPIIQRVKVYLIGVFTSLWQKAQPVLNWLGTVAIPAIVVGLSGVGDFVIKVADWFTSNWGVIGPLLAGIAISFVAITTAMKAYYAIQKIIQIATVLWTNKQLILNAVMSANPIGLIITGVGLLIGAIILVVQHWDTVKQALVLGAQLVYNFFKIIFTGIKNFFVNIFNSIKDFIKTWGIRIFAFISAPFLILPLLIFKNMDKIKGFFGSAIEWIKNAFQGVGEFIGAVFDGLLAVVKAPINFILRGVNTMINALNSISIDIPDWVPIVGGKKFGFTIPQIPYLAKGTNNFKGGPAVINERGGEMAIMPSGSQVIPADKTDKILDAPRGKVFKIDKLIGQLIIQQQPGQDARSLAAEVLGIVFEQLSKAEEIAGSDDMGVLVNG